MRKAETTQAVTNAVLAERFDTLTKAFESHTETMKAGFAGIHERQDTTNGKVLKAGTDIVENKTATDIAIAAVKAEFKYNRIIWYFLTVAVTVIVSLASYIVYSK